MKNDTETEPLMNSDHLHVQLSSHPNDVLEDEEARFNHDTDGDHDFDRMTESHTNVQDYINDIFGNLFYVIFSLGCTYAMRSNIFILYAKQFDDNTLLISIFIYFSYILNAFVSLFFAIIGEQWRFDHLLIIATICDIICFYLKQQQLIFIC